MLDQEFTCFFRLFFKNTMESRTHFYDNKKGNYFHLFQLTKNMNISINKDQKKNLIQRVAIIVLLRVHVQPCLKFGCHSLFEVFE